MLPAQIPALNFSKGRRFDRVELTAVAYSGELVSAGFLQQFHFFLSQPIEQFAARTRVKRRGAGDDEGGGAAAAGSWSNSQHAERHVGSGEISADVTAFEQTS